MTSLRVAYIWCAIVATCEFTVVCVIFHPDSRSEEQVKQLHAKLNDPTSIRPLQGLGVDRLPGRIFVYTTNVDGFFLRSGFRSEEVGTPSIIYATNHDHA